jgi:ribonuclease I
MTMTSTLVYLIALQFSILCGAEVPAPTTPQLASHITNTPGAFDTFTLSLTYHNDYCVEYPTDAECNPSVGTVIKGVVLHGLWPDRADDPKSTYGYCDLPASKVNANWCAADIDVKSQIPAQEFSALLAQVPGTVSCLYNHEWYAHGTCSGIPIGPYFADAMILAQRFQTLPATQKFIADSAGTSVDRAGFVQALAADLGPNAADSAIVLCRVDKTTNTTSFSSFSIALDKVHYMDFPAQSGLAQLKPYVGPSGVPAKDVGNCPDTGIVVAP